MANLKTTKKQKKNPPKQKNPKVPSPHPSPWLFYAGISFKTWSFWENKSGKATEENCLKVKFWTR